MIRGEAEVSERQGRPRFFGLGPLNLGLLLAGVAVIVVGYVLLDRGSTVAAPLFLVLGYAVLVPAGLLVGFRGSDREAGE